MELRQLQYFAEVARVGSFLGAAERLDVAQPTLWRQVKALESELSVQLFERAGRGIVITSAGSQLLPLATQLLAKTDVIRVLSSNLAHGRAGMVTVACASPHVPRFLAPLIGQFHQTHPDIHVAVRESPGLPPVEQVLSGESDFVTALARTDERLAGHRLGEIQVVVVTSDDHPWRYRTKIAVSELRGAQVLSGEPSSLTGKLLEPALREGGFALDIALETSNASTLIALARNGLGVAVIADDNLVMYSDTTWPPLVDERYPMGTSVWICWDRQRSLSPAARAFADHVLRSP